MIKLIDLTFYANHEYDDPLALLQSQQHSIGYIEFIKDRINMQVVKHFGGRAQLVVNGVRYKFFKGINKPWYISFETLRYLAEQKADIVVIQGLGFPVQVIMLRLWLGKKPIIIAQHHAERPKPGLGKFLQRLADKCINAYLFTAQENAAEWYAKKIINDKGKYHELLELSTAFTRQDKINARLEKGIGCGDVFLWVGRLDANKDPLTVLKGFAMLLNTNPGAKLYMVFQEKGLLAEVEALINNIPPLKSSVYLLGKIPHGELQAWFSAADFYISGSHREGSGTALIESMACGCIPVVTNIPSFNMITANGQYGYLYEAGNADSLLSVLAALPTQGRDKLSNTITAYFQERLSHKAIADSLFTICVALLKKQQ